MSNKTGLRKRLDVVLGIGVVWIIAALEPRHSCSLTEERIQTFLVATAIASCNNESSNNCSCLVILDKVMLDQFRGQYQQTQTHTWYSKERKK